MKDNKFSISVEEALNIFSEGGMIILTDDEDRENEGDLVMAAEKVTADSINFMITEGRGLVCCALTADKTGKIGLEKLRQSGSTQHHTNFLLPVDAVEGVTTGISTTDRAKTVSALCNPGANAADFVTPGHLFPLQAVPGGVLERQGHTEAVVELCRLSGLREAGVICEIINRDGTMSRKPDLLEFAEKHKLRILTIRDLVRYLEGGTGIVRVNTTDLPTKYGDFKMHLYRSHSDKNENLPFALTLGEILPNESVLVRVHSECLTGDLIGSLKCDCGEQFDASLKMIQKEGRGILVYLRQEGRGIGLENKIEAYNLQQDKKMDTVEANIALGFGADDRSYIDAASILRDLGAEKIKLLTNNPDKINQLTEYGLDIVKRVPLVVGKNRINSGYFHTKKIKMNHLY